MKYLTTVVETYRIATEGEVERTVQAAKEDNRFILVKYNCEKKEVKAKGEIIDEYFKLSLTKQFNNIKEPECVVNIEYEVE